MRVVSGIDKRSLDWPRCEGKAVEKLSGAALTSAVNNKMALSLSPLSLIGIYGI